MNLIKTLVHCKSNYYSLLYGIFYRTPLAGLYVCGVSTYPGGLVLGGPGYLGANKVAEDLGVRKWWKPTSEMERYIKTYLE